MFFLNTICRRHVVHPYSNIDTKAAWKKLRFNSLGRPDFYVIDSLSEAVHIFARRILT